MALFIQTSFVVCEQALNCGADIAVNDGRTIAHSGKFCGLRAGACGADIAVNDGHTIAHSGKFCGL